MAKKRTIRARIVEALEKRGEHRQRTDKWSFSPHGKHGDTLYLYLGKAGICNFNRLENIMKRLLCIASSLVLLAGCQAATKPYLDQAQSYCKAGYTKACESVPSLQAQVSYEDSENAKKVAVGILLGLAVVATAGAAGYAAARPSPVYYSPTVYVVCKPWWAC